MTTGPLACSSRRRRGEGQRQLLADVAAILVDDREPIGVGVLREADRGPHRGHDRAEFLQIGFRRLGRMIVVSVGSVTQDDRPGSQGFQERDAEPPPCPVARVEDHLETPPPDRRDVHGLEDAGQVPGIGIIDRAGSAQAIPARPAKIADLPPIEQDAALLGPQHHAPRLEELEAIVTGWVMRRRDLDPARQSSFAHEPADGRRRGRPRPQHVVTRRGDTGLDGQGEDRRGHASVMADDDRPRLALARIGRGELHHRRRVEAVADDPTKPGDARDPRSRPAHPSSPSSPRTIHRPPGSSPGHPAWNRQQPGFSVLT